MSVHTKNPLKLLLRKEIKAILSKVGDSSKAGQSSIVAEKILSSDAFKNAQRIGIYLSLGSEISTGPILEEALRQNKEIYVPSYNGPAMVLLKVHSLDDVNTLPLTKWNIPQPTDDGSRRNAFENGGLDLILLPGVAFTRDGKRLGHGMGYYDKFLQRYFVNNPHRHRATADPNATMERTHLIGLAFQEQILDEIPVTDTDVILDEVITA